MDKSKLKILLIENQQNVAEEIRKELFELGHMVSISKSTDNGLLRSKAHHFDFFIVNCGHDSKQGLNFANTILKIDEYENPPFLFIVNQKTKVDVRLRKFDRRFDIMRLPFDATELRIRMNRILSEPVYKAEIKPYHETIAKVTISTDKVLLVEDNPLNQKVLGMFISRLGYEYDIAANGLIAVELCQKENYPYILMDIYMPGMDGTEATEKIRERELKTGHRAKIIAITANESEESVKRCYDSGMDDYLVKPFTLEVLKEKLV